MGIFQRIGAVLAGLLAGGLSVGAIEGLSSFVYPMPAGIELDDKEAVAAFVKSLPAGAFLFVLVAWSAGCFLGAFVARRLAPGRSAIQGAIVWAFFSIASIVNLIMIPHPAWFAIAAIIACFVFGLLGLVMAAPRAYICRCVRTINAPIGKVFKTLATIDEFKQAVPHITKVEILSESHYGVGTKFRETRVLNGKEASTELEVAELVENEHVRLVSDAGGTIWDTVFRVRQEGDAVEMDMQMDATPYSFPARVITPMIMGMVTRFVGQDMDSVKAFCEKSYGEC
jgi:carbon monoxide dehydrogenase subunit G